MGSHPRPPRSGYPALDFKEVHGLDLIVSCLEALGRRGGAVRNQVPALAFSSSAGFHIFIQPMGESKYVDRSGRDTMTNPQGIRRAATRGAHGSTYFPYLAREQIVRNRAKGLAGERHFQQIEWLKGSQVTRTGSGSDYKVKGLFEATPRLVEVKTGNARLSRLQKATGPQVVRENIYLNAAVAVGVGVPAGMAGAKAVRWLIKNHIRLKCGSCGSEATLDHHLCPQCRTPFSRKTEFWIGLGLVGVAVLILILCILTYRLDLSLMFLVGGIAGAGIDLVLDSLWANFSPPSPAGTPT